MASASKKPSIVKGKANRNPALPRVPVTIDGETYHLEYNFNSIAIAEEHTGLNLFNSFDFRGLSVVKFRAMLWSSLLVDRPEITIEEAGDLVRYDTLPILTLALVEAWLNSRPEIAKDEAGKDEAEVAVSE
jgi:hypothetical protein